MSYSTAISGKVSQHGQFCLQIKSVGSRLGIAGLTATRAASTPGGMLLHTSRGKEGAIDFMSVLGSAPVILLSVLLISLESD